MSTYWTDGYVHDVIAERDQLRRKVERAEGLLGMLEYTASLNQAVDAGIAAKQLRAALAAAADAPQPTPDPEELPLVFCMSRAPHPPHDWTNDVSPMVHCWGWLDRAVMDRAEAAVPSPAVLPPEATE